jgi:hypothetical protein
MRTQSEKWFEQFCEAQRILISRIEESVSRMPDYSIELNGQRIIVEVKEIQPNAEERASIEKMRRTGVGSAVGGTPGERVRGKISDGNGQLKAITNGQLPSLLVLCDIRYECGQISGHLDSYNIRVAMEGLDQVVFAVPRDPANSPYVVGTKSGPRKKMTEHQNTSISAIGVLYTPPDEPIGLIIYHNRFAAISLDPRILKGHVTEQFCLSSSVGTPSQWERCEP